jgi:integrase
LRVHVGDRQYVSETFTGSERDARKALARLEVAAQERRAPRPSRDTVGQLLDDWWSMKPWKSVGARRHAREDLDRYLIPHLGDVVLARLTDRQITTLYRGLQTPGPDCLAKRGKPLADSTVERLHTTLDAALNWGVRKGRLGLNPANPVDVPAAPPTRVRGPETAELVHLLVTADARGALRRRGVRAGYTVTRRVPGSDKTVTYTVPDREGSGDDYGIDFAAFVRAVAFTGRRREDVLGLTVADVRGDEGAVVFDKRVVLGGKGVGVVVEALDKNYRSARLDVDAVTMRALAGVIGRRRSEAKAVGVTLAKGAFIFSADLGRTPWRPDAVSRDFAVLRDAAGLPAITLHSLRHGHVTELLENGLDIEAVAKRVGDNPTTIYRVYAHARRVSDRRAAAIMDRVFNGGSGHLVALEGGR